MISFMHIAKNVKVTELSLYEDAILDACCHNIPADDELWYRIVEVSVLLLTCTQRSNPRSPWYTLFLLVNCDDYPVYSQLVSCLIFQLYNL